MRFQLGDAVRVAALPNSEWQGAHGVVMEVLERGEPGEGMQECSVQLPEERRRWFLSTHLAKTVPEKLLRFFRSEVSDRWKQLNPDQVAPLIGDRDQLIELLQRDCDFALRRAQSEVDDFLAAFISRMDRAAEDPAKPVLKGPSIAA